MPFLRVLRDKRGYETTYLMHWYRDGQRQRSRILYVFRTPPGVRVGRDPLDSEIIRELEARHPEIDWDWHALASNKQVVESPAETRRPKKRKPSDEAGAPVEAVAPAAPALVTPAAPSKSAVPATIEGETPDEQMAFLAGWYDDLRVRVPERTTDPARRGVLEALVERINPDPWTDADQITTGLQQAAEALERLSRVFSPRRRRSRRGRRAGAGEAQASATAVDYGGANGGDAPVNVRHPLEPDTDPE